MSRYNQRGGGWRKSIRNAFSFCSTIEYSFLVNLCYYWTYNHLVQCKVSLVNIQVVSFCQMPQKIITIALIIKFYCSTNSSKMDKITNARNRYVVLLFSKEIYLTNRTNKLALKSDKVLQHFPGTPIHKFLIHPLPLLLIRKIAPIRRLFSSSCGELQPSAANSGALWAYFLRDIFSEFFLTFFLKKNFRNFFVKFFGFQKYYLWTFFF